jgi:hypothetical protein
MDGRDAIVKIERIETLILARLSTYKPPRPAKQSQARMVRARRNDTAQDQARKARTARERAAREQIVREHAARKQAEKLLEKLAKALYPYAPATFDPRTWRELISRVLRDLQDRQLVTAELRIAGVDELRRRMRTSDASSWDGWERELSAEALGIGADDSKARKRLSQPHGWAAAIAARTLRLPMGGLGAVADSLVWRELGLDGDPQECPQKVRAHFLQKHVPASGRPDRLVRLLATRAVGAPSAEAEVLRRHLIKQWLTDVEPLMQKSSGTSVPTLIETVRDITQRARDGVFGDRKVFISSVWHALRKMPLWTTIEIDDFKAHLVAAHRKRELVLARADLVAAMDPALVAASETQTDGATFHFIVREPVG